MHPAKQAQLSEQFQAALFEDILPFWWQQGIDHQYGGIQTCRDRDGSLLDSDKGVWQQGRFAWLLGELYNNVEQRPEWLTQARRTIQFIEDYCFDPSDGRMWFHVTADGKPIRKRRYAFSESFAAIAWGELAKATGDTTLAGRAEELFQSYLQHHLQPLPSNAKFTDTRPQRGIGFPMIMIVTASELRQSIALPSADHWIDHGLDLIQRYFLKADLQCVMETVGSNGELLPHFDGRTLNPGHAIECAWFVMAEGWHRRDERLVQLGTQMLDWMWERGWDKLHGGLLYFVGVDGRPIQEYWHDMKFWWPHNELVIATLMAYLLTGNTRYEAMFDQAWEWTRSKFPDPQFGEWFGYFNRAGEVSSTLKGNLWKGPFHIPRMYLTCWQLLQRL